MVFVLLMLALLPGLAPDRPGVPVIAADEAPVRVGPGEPVPPPRPGTIIRYVCIAPDGTILAEGSCPPGA